MKLFLLTGLCTNILIWLLYSYLHLDFFFIFKHMKEQLLHSTQTRGDLLCWILLKIFALDPIITLIIWDNTKRRGKKIAFENAITSNCEEKETPKQPTTNDLKELAYCEGYIDSLNNSINTDRYRCAQLKTQYSSGFIDCKGDGENYNSTLTRSVLKKRYEIKKRLASESI